MRSGYKHWKNSQEPGATLFITATCLDFAHLFQRHSMREFMASHLIESHIDAKARLHAFAVMTHHFHCISSAPEERTCSWLVQRIKKTASEKMLELLLPTEVEQVQQQVGLNERRLWMRPFRGIPIRDERMMTDTSRYIHLNPVRSGFCEYAEEYHWSSSRLFGLDLYELGGGLRLAECLAEFTP